MGFFFGNSHALLFRYSTVQVENVFSMIANTGCRKSDGGLRYKAADFFCDHFEFSGRTDQGKTDIAFSSGAKSTAGGSYDTCFIHKLFYEGDRGESLGDREPDEHGAIGVRYIPASLSQTAAQSVPAPLVLPALGMNLIHRTGEGGNRRFLGRIGYTEIVLAPQEL